MDGDLRLLLRKNLPQAQWTPIETGATAHGVPDAEYCFPGGHQGFVECKKTRGWKVTIRPEQVGWLLRRSRMGGKSFVCVRRMGSKGEDELWLYRGRDAGVLAAEGLRGAQPVLVLTGGPARWEWADVGSALTAG